MRSNPIVAASTLSCLALGAVHGGDAAGASPLPASLLLAATAPAPVPVEGWTSQGRLGGFVGNVASNHAETSRDPAVSGTTNSTSWLASLDGAVGWRMGADSFDHALKARYGRIRVEGGGWGENHDEIRIDGVYRREVDHPTFVYLSWGAESVFTGPPPDAYAFDPTVGKVGSGIGQRVADFLPDHNQLEWRLGGRGQKGWGKSADPGEDGVQTGAEGYLRYDHDVFDPGDPAKRKPNLRFFAQYEGFGEFNDLRHVANLVTMGLAFQLSRFLGAEFGVRAYYESRPKESAASAVGYDEWGVRQDTLVGLTCLW